MANTYEQVDTTCTTVEENKKYVKLPPGTKGYLTEKVMHALKFPTHVVRKMPGGETMDVLLKQLVVTTGIRIDEAIANFRWMYKAEVSFDMTVAEAGRAPIPFLSGDKALIKSEGPRRRHSLNPFPPGLTPGYLRRPDVIIVRNFAMRWPGRGNVDRDGAPHVDNLLRLVEIKFPGDNWGPDQEGSYVQIAGSANRMSVLDVSDCDGELERSKQRAGEGRPSQVPSVPPVLRPPVATPGRRRGKQGAPVPVRTTQPIAGKVWYEPWLADVQHASSEISRAVASLWDSAQNGAGELSVEAQEWLRQRAPWVFEAGRWMYEAGVDTWTWVNEKGQAVYRFTSEKLKDAWREIQRQTDLTWEMLKQVEWGQLAVDVIKGAAIAVAAVVVIVSGAYLVYVVGAAVIAALSLLIGIVTTATAAAIAALGAVLVTA